MKHFGLIVGLITPRLCAWGQVEDLKLTVSGSCGWVWAIGWAAGVAGALMFVCLVVWWFRTTRSGRAPGERSSVVK